MTFGFFRKSLFFKDARCTGLVFRRHGLEMSGEFVILLRYGTVELRETGRGAECRLQKSWNRIRVFHYIG